MDRAIAWAKTALKVLLWIVGVLIFLAAASSLQDRGEQAVIPLVFLGTGYLLHRAYKAIEVLQMRIQRLEDALAEHQRAHGWRTTLPD